MVSRKCPKCGIVRFSADTKDWTCEKCGALVGSELSKSARERSAGLKLVSKDGKEGRKLNGYI